MIEPSLFFLSLSFSMVPFFIIQAVGTDTCVQTDAAAKQLKLLKETKGQTSPTVRLGLDKKGCNGSSYTLEFPNELKKFPADEVVEEKGSCIPFILSFPSTPFRSS